MTRRVTSKLGIGTLALLTLPLLAAPKCFEPVSSPTPDSATPTPPPGGTFVPAKACPTAGEARLKIVDFSYQVDCGCREASGKVCSIPRGTRVVWQFIDAEEHNVASDGDGFGNSGERLVGTFEHRFDAAGNYDYGCTIHTEMTGYSIVVE